MLAALDAIRGPRGRRVMAAAVGLIAITVAGGYASNRASGPACERHAAAWLASTPMSGRAFNVLNYRGDDAESLAIFRAAGVAGVRQTAPGVNAWPWAEVRHARSVAPFVMEVDYGWCAEPLVGQGGRRRYLCLFGRVIEIGDRTRWVS